MHKILGVVEHYLPGYKAGGPTQSVANIVSWLGDEFEFRIIARDRDFGETSPYSGIQTGIWLDQGKAQVMYLAPRQLRWLFLQRLLVEEKYDLLYLNSFFSPLSIRIVGLRRLGKIPESPLILAPRGELSPGALNIKRQKKSLYLQLSRKLGLYQGINWQASSKYEAIDISKVLADLNIDNLSSVRIAPNLPSNNDVNFSPTNPPAKNKGCLHIIYLSRITRKKHLDYAIKLLKEIDGDIQYDIYGPIDDDDYWNECQDLIQTLPHNVQVVYQGPLAPAQAKERFGTYHVFLFPTRSENFGHVILESLSAGCPVLISDQTPWQELQDNHAGWDLPLGQPKSFRAVLTELVAMDQMSWKRWSDGALKFANSFINDSKVLEANRDLFLSAMASIN